MTVCENKCMNKRIHEWISEVMKRKIAGIDDRMAEGRNVIEGMTE